MSNIGSYIFILFILVIVIFGVIKKVNVYDCFIEGAKSGIKTAINIVPTFVTIFVAISLFRSSGVMTELCNLLSGICDKVGFPKEVLPLCLISPISGSGSLAVFETILKDNGADSFPGRVASVISGSTETTFYAIAVYYGAIGIKKTRHTVICSLCADFTSYLLASIFVKLFFY